eukprot:2521904-Karenia_brevis.AAC.1
MSREVTNNFAPAPSKSGVILPIPLFKRNYTCNHVALQSIKKVPGLGRTWVPSTYAVYNVKLLPDGSIFGLGGPH